MKLNWGFGIAVVYVLFAVSMVLFAIKASSQKYDLVTDSYYNAAVNYQKTIDAENNASRAESKLGIKFLPGENVMEINSNGTTLKKITGILSFYKPDKASDDFTLNFNTDDSGKQIIPLKILAHGYWKVNATWNENGKTCSNEVRIFVP